MLIYMNDTVVDIVLLIDVDELKHDRCSRCRTMLYSFYQAKQCFIRISSNGNCISFFRMKVIGKL